MAKQKRPVPAKENYGFCTGCKYVAGGDEWIATCRFHQGEYVQPVGVNPRMAAAIVNGRGYTCFHHTGLPRDVREQVESVEQQGASASNGIPPLT